MPGPFYGNPQPPLVLCTNSRPCLGNYLGSIGHKFGKVRVAFVIRVFSFLTKGAIGTYRLKFNRACSLLAGFSFHEYLGRALERNLFIVLFVFLFGRYFFFAFGFLLFFFLNSFLDGWGLGLLGRCLGHIKVFGYPGFSSRIQY